MFDRCDGDPVMKGRLGQGKGIEGSDGRAVALLNSL